MKNILSIKVNWLNKRPTQDLKSRVGFFIYYFKPKKDIPIKLANKIKIISIPN